MFFHRLPGNSNQNKEITSHHLSKRMEATNAGRDVEENESSFTVSGCVDGVFDKEYRDFSKI